MIYLFDFIIILYIIYIDLFVIYNSMGKIHNIATGIIMAGAVLGINGHEAVAQSTGNSNSKAGIGQVQSDTNNQLLWLDQYDYKKMLHMDISLLSPEVVKKVMLDRINEIRKEYALPTLEYNTVLDSIALEFAKEKNGTERWKDPYCHFDKNKGWPYDRIKKAWLLPQIKLTNINGDVYWADENIVTQEGSIYHIINLLMWSKKWHRETLLSPYINSVWFWYIPWWNIIVQNFVYFKNNK